MINDVFLVKTWVDQKAAVSFVVGSGLSLIAQSYRKERHSRFYQNGLPRVEISSPVFNVVTAYLFIGYYSDTRVKSKKMEIELDDSQNERSDCIYTFKMI